MSTSRQNWAVAMANAHRDKQSKPNLAQEMSIAAAYEIQSAMVAELGGSIVGYKGALSAKPAQEMFGVSAPLLGVLLDSAECQSGFTLSEMVLPMLEVEVGFIVARPLDSPITDDEFTRLPSGNLFSEALITIELAEVAYSSRPSAQDLIAGNSAAGRFMRGGSLPIEALNNLSVDLRFLGEQSSHPQTSGEQVNSGVSSEMGNQYHLAASLLNEALSRGYSVEAGMLVMTGSIGKIIPAKPGFYEARFLQSSLGQQTSFSFHLGS